MYKTCSVCGKVHDSRMKCKRYYTNTDDESRLRSTNKWTMKSLDIREKANYLCEVCFDQGYLTYDDLEVHHIEKLKDNHDLLLDDYNLICLCEYHHKQADKGELDIEYLRKLARSREKRSPMPF